MAGGRWDAQNKELPGVYINFKSTPGLLAMIGSRGVVAIPMLLSWGDIGDIITIVSIEDVITKLGYDITDPRMLFIRQLLRGTTLTQGASQIHVYRLPTTGAVAANATLGPLTATAACKGERGNDISIVVNAHPDSEYDVDSYAVLTVETIVDGMVMDSQTVGTFTDSTDYEVGKVGDLANNNWVVFSGSATSELEPSAGAPLSGGVDGTIAATAYSSFLTTIEQVPFNVVVYDGSDPIIQSSFALFVQRLSYNTGRYCQAVMAKYPNADNETAISVKNGITLNEGTVLTANQATWWVGGSTAGASYNESLTYGVHPDAVDVELVDLTEAKREGSFTFFKEYGAIKVLSDINTFTGYTPEKGKSFSKNRVIRVLFAIANDIYRAFSLYYIGKLDNDAEGRNLLKAEIVGYINQLQGNRAVQNFSKDDVEVLPGIDVDAVVINVAVQPVDAVEKIYMTVTVS